MNLSRFFPALLLAAALPVTAADADPLRAVLEASRDSQLGVTVVVAGHEVATGEREVAEVHGESGHWRAAGRDPINQPPAGESARPVAMNQVSVREVGREARPIDEQHTPAGAGEQHGGGSAGAAGADDDRVVA